MRFMVLLLWLVVMVRRYARPISFIMILNRWAGKCVKLVESERLNQEVRQERLEKAEASGHCPPSARMNSKHTARTHKSSIQWSLRNHGLRRVAARKMMTIRHCNFWNMTPFHTGARRHVI
jgi:hypothetical protein